MRLSDDEFDRYVRDAIAAIDQQFRGYLDEVPVMVEDKPDEQICLRLGLPDRTGLLGLFRGVPLNRRSVNAADGPNQIVLYRKNILRGCDNAAELAEQIRKTLIHELGHYVGFSEKQLRRHQY